MNAIERIKTDPNLPLRPNPYLVDPEIPYLYQRRGALLLVARPRLLLGDDVGLGKTLQSIVALTYLKTRDPQMKTLVLTEVGALRQWQQEFAWLAPKLGVQIIGAQTGDADARNAAFEEFASDVVISSYSMLYRHPETIRAGLRAGYTVICDEPPFRNPKSQVSVLSKALLTDATRAYGLTATVIEGNLIEAFGIYDALVPGLFPTKSFFIRRWCETKPVRWRRGLGGKMVPCPWPVKIVGYKNLQELKKWIEPVFYARLQTNPEVEQQLPDVVTRHVPITLTYRQSRKVIEAEEGILALPGGTDELMVLERLLRCQQLVDDPRLLDVPEVGAKTDTLIEMLNGSLRGQSTLVFTRFARMADLLCEEIKRRTGLDPALLKGGLTKKQREQAVDHFQAGRKKVMVITLAGGRALNLQTGSQLVFFDGPWLHGQERQVIGREKRTGSVHSHVVVHYFLGELHPRALKAARRRSPVTIDQRVMRVREVGERVFNAIVGDSGENTVKKQSAVASAVVRQMRGGDVELV